MRAVFQVGKGSIVRRADESHREFFRKVGLSRRRLAKGRSDCPNRRCRRRPIPCVLPGDHNRSRLDNRPGCRKPRFDQTISRMASWSGRSFRRYPTLKRTSLLTRFAEAVKVSAMPRVSSRFGGPRSTSASEYARRADFEYPADRSETGTSYFRIRVKVACSSMTPWMRLSSRSWRMAVRSSSTNQECSTCTSRSRPCCVINSQYL